MWEVEQLLLWMCNFPDHCHLSLQNSSHQLCPDMLQILTFDMGMSSLALIHQIILKCILIRFLSQSNEKTRRILSHIYPPHTAQGQIDRNVVSSKLNWQHRNCHISLHCLNAKQQKTTTKKITSEQFGQTSLKTILLWKWDPALLANTIFILASDIPKTYLESRMKVKPWGDLQREC